jgi:thiol-disulfide isomerase/thioredoxin
MAKKYPHSDIAMYNLYRQAKRQNNKDKQVQMLVRYINADYQESYVNKIGTRDAYVRLFKYYAKHDSIKKMKRIARLWLQPNPRIFKNPKKAIDYYRAANIIVNNTHQYELALQYARKALQLLPNEPVSRAITTDKHGIRPILTYKSKKEEIKQRKKQKARILTTLSAIYKKQEEFDQAKTVLKRAITLVDNDTHLWQHDMFEVAETYQQTNHPRKAFYAYRAFLRKKPLNNYVLKKLKESYIAYNGSAKGFKKHVKDLQKARSAKQKKLKKQWVNKQAPSLAHATDLKGVSLDTTSLAGKVIVLDFWATWCGPCKASFPHIQKVYDQFKDNPDVKFVILNSAWNNSRKQARKWTQKQSYTFPFYYDKGSKITTSYGVRGIPTTFVIDKNARIQFKDIGNSGTSMEQKLTLKINMALGENEK